MRRSATGRGTSRSTLRCWKARGVRSPRAGAPSSPSSGSSTTSARGRTSFASPRTASSPSAKPPWARTRAVCSPATSLSAWLGVAQARAAGSDVQLTAEIGLWGYEPTAADPFVLNHRNFPRSTMLDDAGLVLGTLVGGPGTTTVACLGGAQVDRSGNVNSTLVPDGPFLVGSGGGNDVASVAAEAIVVATLTPGRTPPECGYVTSPGRAVRALVTDLGVLEKVDGDELVLTPVAA